MALGRKSTAASDGSNKSSSLDEKRQPHRDPALETGVYGYDVEKTEERGRKMSRLGGPSAIGINAEEDSVVSVGKQVELEADNAIKYRTCSWQKVILLPVSLRQPVDSIPSTSSVLRLLEYSGLCECLGLCESCQWP